jgi:hypothetical protein
VRVRVRARSPEARAHEGEEGWGEGFLAREPHTETITLSLDYAAALSPPAPLWSTRWLDTSTSLGRQAGDAGARHVENLQPKGCNTGVVYRKCTPYYEYNGRGYAVLPGVDIRCHAC